MSVAVQRTDRCRSPSGPWLHECWGYANIERYAKPGEAILVFNEHVEIILILRHFTD